MLAFPGLVYKMWNQEGSDYPDAHMQRTATTYKANVSEIRFIISGSN